MEKGKEIEKYVEYLQSEELAEGTIQSYLREAGRLKEFLSEQKITKSKTVEYKAYLSKKGYSPATCNLYIIAANRYLKYIGHPECMLKTLRLQSRHSLENMLTIEEYYTLLMYAKKSGREKYYMILRTLAMTGIRISELKFFVVGILDQKVIMVTGKQKTREICLPEKLLLELQNYCLSNEISNGCIFRGEEQKPISRVAVYKMMVKIAEMAGVPKEKAHPHNLRHLFAVTYMEHYGNIFELADLLGHSNLETTRIYARSTAEKRGRKSTN